MSKTDLSGDKLLKQNALPTAEPVPEPDADDEAEGRRMDPEVRVIGTMLRMLKDLDAGARERVVTYLSARYRSDAKI